MPACSAVEVGTAPRVVIVRIIGVAEDSRQLVPGILHACDATDLSKELYNSNQSGTRDALNEWDKFTVPVVANGEVFVTSNFQLTVYGLLP